MNIKHIFIGLICIICGVEMTQAQVQVEQRLDSMEIPIGEQTQLHLMVTMKRGMTAQLPSFEYSQAITPGVEVLEQQDVDTIETADGCIQFGRNYTLTSFDERLYAIPALKVKVNGKEYHGNQLALKVLTVDVDTIHPNQFFGPKDVQNNPFLWREWSPLVWLSILIVLLCLLVCYLVIRLKQNKPIITHIRIVKKIPPHQRALKEINDIKQSHPDTQESQKEYYTRLTDALRIYIEERFGFNAMEMTSSEIIEQLRKNGDETMITELTELFQTADLVKFAKYQTLINENDMNLVNAVNFIDQTKLNNMPTEERIVPQLSDSDKKTRQNRIAIKGGIGAIAIIVIVLLVYIIYSLMLLII